MISTTAPTSYADRAKYSASREGAPIMPSRPTDTSKNGQRAGTRKSPRRAIR